MLFVTFLVPLKSLNDVGALRWFHNVYTFRPMVQEILNIEQLFHLKYNKIKNLRKIGMHIWYYWKMLKI